MNTPPLLLGVALLYWGWQAGCREIALALAIALEASRWLPRRWDIEQRDFDRLWNFCAVLFLGAAVYAISTGNGPHIIGDWSGAADPSGEQPNVPERLIRAQLAFIQWWPLTVFPFVLAQAYARSPGVDWGTFSLFMRARRARDSQPAVRRRLLLFHPFFAVCLGCACIGQPPEMVSFPAITLLLAWALWDARPRRFALPLWGAAILLAVGVGFLGHLGLRRLYGAVQSYAPSWFQRSGEGRADAREARTALGMIGRLKLSGRILYRIEPQPGMPAPDLLREASYNVFKSPSWLAPGNARDFGSLPPGPEENTWVLRRQRPADSVVSVAGSLPDGRGLLPVPNGVARLENFPATTVSTNRLGALRVDEGPGFFALDCRFGPGRGMDDPPEATDLAVPSEEEGAVVKTAGELGLTNTAPEEAMRRLLRFFGEKFSYSLERGPRAGGRGTDSPTTRFLTTARVGHCEHFATATTLLLRQAGIPARYATGFAVQERSGTGYVVRGRHAHAWCLVFHDGAWHDFDTTPASWVESDARRAGPMEFLSDLWSRLWFEFDKLRYGQSWLQRYAGWLVLLLLLLTGMQLFVGRRWRQTRREHAQAAAKALLPGMDSELYDLERELAARGFVRPPSENFTTWLRRIAPAPQVGALRPLLETVLALHNRLRFDPLGLSTGERHALRQQAQHALAELRAQSDPPSPARPK